jgi:hypothetical protein
VDVSPSRKSFSINKNLAERVGFEKALSGRYFAFNEMPPTVVLTGSYVLSHLEQ